MEGLNKKEITVDAVINNFDDKVVELIAERSGKTLEEVKKLYPDNLGAYWNTIVHSTHKVFSGEYDAPNGDIEEGNSILALNGNISNERGYPTVPEMVEEWKTHSQVIQYNDVINYCKAKGIKTIYAVPFFNNGFFACKIYLYKVEGEDVLEVKTE